MPAVRLCIGQSARGLLLRTVAASVLPTMAPGTAMRPVLWGKFGIVVAIQPRDERAEALIDLRPFNNAVAVRIQELESTNCDRPGQIGPERLEFLERQLAIFIGIECRVARRNRGIDLFLGKGAVRVGVDA